jgi:hypothetical protein
METSALVDPVVVRDKEEVTCCPEGRTVCAAERICSDAVVKMHCVLFHDEFLSFGSRDQNSHCTSPADLITNHNHDRTDHHLIIR